MVEVNNMDNGLRKRVSAVIVKNGKILLIRRVKPGEEYFIIPGGGVDEGETQEEALIREVKEELTLDVVKHKFLFSIENIEVPQKITIHKGNRNEHFYLIEEHTGTPEIGGPEKERMNENNQYHIEWVEIKRMLQMKNIFPESGIELLIAHFTKNKQFLYT